MEKTTGNRQKVLIVDDEARNQRIIGEILDGLVDFKQASSGEEALAMIEAYAPDLVLLDIMMPGMDGYEVCRQIRKNPQLNFTKVILVSGKAMLEERLKGYEVGADDYMTKPFMPDELLAKTKVFLRLTHAEKQLNDFNLALEHRIAERTQQLLETESKLVHSAKMAALGEMAGGIAHEINTPLGTISLLGEQIEEIANTEPLNKPSLLQMTKTIDETVRRISVIINGLRTFSRDGGNDLFDSTPVKQIVEMTLALCKEKLRHASVKVHVDPIADDLEIQCRAVQISQVILNLINNACDAIETLPDKWIRVAVIPEADGVAITITDSGNGIPKEVLAKLFQPFFTTKEIGKGTGLGLSISKGIVDAHHGRLTVDTSCKNTRFVLYLPAQQPETPAKKQAA